MTIKQLFPIGTVVLLKGGKKRVMIIGVKQADKDNPDVEYDYAGVLYPEGHIGEEYNALFNQDDIAQVFFRGYEDIERQQFIEKLSEFYEKQEGNQAA